MRSDCFDKTGCGTDAVRSRGVRALIVILLALTVACTFVVSSATLSRELHHDCAGDGCAVCAEMATGLHLARGGFSMPDATAALSAVSLCFAMLSLSVGRRYMQPTTLVSLKVQLND